MIKSCILILVSGTYNMKTLSLILIAAILAGTRLRAAPLFETQTVHQTYPKNAPNYRIPALLAVPNGDLIIFSEKRIDGPSDFGPHTIAAIRSSDRGKTWSEEKIIFEDGEKTCADIVPCVDKERGRIFLFFLRDKEANGSKRGSGNGNTGIFTYISSDDNGLTWRGPVNVHSSVTGADWDSGKWAQRYGVGPGAGAIQVSKGSKKGRLLVPARHAELFDNGATDSVSHVIYSDDHGETWHLGPNIARNGNECRLVELQNGDIMMQMRNANPADEPDNSTRLVAISRDGGDTWGPAYRDEALVSTAVHAGVRVYDLPGSAANGIVLFSNPASPIRTKEYPYGRYRLTVRWSRDHGRTWSAGRPIYPHESSYSDMAVLDDGTIGIVYERGARGTNHYWDELQFARFNLEWLFAPPHTIPHESPK